MMNNIKIMLRGVGQVMLQNNPLTGLLFLIGIFFNSWIMGVGAIVGGIVSAYAAYLLKYSKEDIKDGLYGFNGVLVGIAVYYFFGLNLISFIFLVLSSIFSTFTMHQMKKRIPAFTAPFIISTWVVILVIKITKIIPFLNSGLEGPVNYFNSFSAINMGLGQVMFQGSIITGIIFFLAIIINSRKSAVYALYGSALGGLVAVLFAFPISMINIGLFGYNAVLCAVALGDGKRNAFIYVTAAVILSVILNFTLGLVGIITLTAPFVLATWIVLFIKNKKHKLIK